MVAGAFLTPATGVNEYWDCVQQSSQQNSWTDAEGNIRPIGKWKENRFTEQHRECATCPQEGSQSRWSGGRG